jgi:hypothetical protein
VLYGHGSVIISPKNRREFLRAIEARGQLTLAWSASHSETDDTPSKASE